MAPATLVAASSARSSTFRWCDPEEDAVLAAAVADFEAARLEAGRCAAEASADSALCASEKARQKALAELATQRQEVVRLRKELTDAQREAKLLSSVEQRLRDELRGNELALHSAVKRGARALRAAALASGAAVPPKVPETLASAANVRWVEAALDMAVDCVLGSRERAAAAAAANALGSDASTASGAADLSAGSWSTGSSSASSGGLAHAAGLLSPRGVVLPAAGALAATFATTPSRLRSPSPAHVTPQRPARPRRPSSRGPKRVSLVTDDDFPEPDERQPPATTLVQEALPQSAGNSEASLLAALRSELHEARLAAATAAGAEEGRVLQEERVAAGLRSEVAALAAELRENARLEDEAARGLSQCRADLTSMEEACTQAVVLAEEGAVRRLRHAESAAEGDREERAEQAPVAAVTGRGRDAGPEGRIGRRGFSAPHLQPPRGGARVATPGAAPACNSGDGTRSRRPARVPGGRRSA
eukprot:TRINITY_DN23522_c0_g1_i1.p1 TRINITY_DN23522_c0_g1~~TRINITY_DN23522_c0_g1_i1.p1  ORF type:complete len:478 (+),score=119.90 TRINITY_DN23522_c0_g1_i1:114-1547(+)